MKIPSMILLACVALVAGVVVQSVLVLVVAPESNADGWQMLVIMGLLSMGVIVGLLRGNRLAWQSGRMLAMVAAVLLILYGFLDMTNQLPGVPSTGNGLWMIASGLCFAVAAGVLHSRGARQHVNLICPKCQVATSRPANLSFSEARCRNPECNNKW